MLQQFDLGSHTRRVSTESSEAQHWFNAGLNWTYAFNQEEGVACFRKVIEHDPECAMGHWGIAYAAGPFYNMPWGDFCDQELTECTRLCHEHAKHALSLCDRVTPVEAAMITALGARFQKDHPVSQAEFDNWDDAYADAMREVYRQYPGDHDVAALFVEAMMTRTPWKLWDVNKNEPAAGADTLECLELLERCIAESKAGGESPHPAILHLHIHVLEMSAQPERAFDSADALFGLCPDAGHMEHMPAHIYVLCGRYDKAKACSIPAIEADRLYLEYAGPMNFYTTARCHDLHMMMYTCMFLGQFEPASAAAREMCANVTPDILELEDRSQMCATLEGYHSTAIHVLVRFGQWQQIVDTPLPELPDLYCVSTSMHHYARTIAHAYLGQYDEAEKERDLFMASLARIPAGRKFFNNTALDTLSVARFMMDGEFEYHLGNFEIAFQHLRESVHKDDGLAYSEPGAWMHPPRHALGALLLEQGHLNEAELVYRTDLGMAGRLQRCAQHPGNVWSLHGLAECLARKNAGSEESAVMRELQSAVALADQEITSSCCCRKNTYPCHNGEPDRLQPDSSGSV